MAASQVNLFMAAIRALESGGGDPRGNYTARNSRSGAYGAYQIIPRYWADWARAAGVPGANITDPKMQDIVARHRMLSLYRKYGRWDHVAGAWFAGEGGLRSFLRGRKDPSDGNLRVSQYMSKIMNTMQGLPGANISPTTDLSRIPDAQMPSAGRMFPSQDPPDLDDALPDEEDPDFAAPLFESVLAMASRFQRQAAQDDETPAMSEEGILEEGGELSPTDPLLEAGDSLLNQGQPVEGEGDDPFRTTQALVDAGSILAGSGIASSLTQIDDDIEEQLAQFFATTSPGASPDTATLDPSTSSNAVIQTASKYLGVPYKWGGTSPKTGFDCSGLVQYVFRQHGIDLPRTSAEQARSGVRIRDLSSAQPGDLLFWHGTGGRPNHIGIYVGEGQMLEAPRTGLNVRVRALTRSPDIIRRVA